MTLMTMSIAFDWGQLKWVCSFSHFFAHFVCFSFSPSGIFCILCFFSLCENGTEYTGGSGWMLVFVIYHSHVDGMSADRSFRMATLCSFRIVHMWVPSPNRRFWMATLCSFRIVHVWVPSPNRSFWMATLCSFRIVHVWVTSPNRRFWRNTLLRIVHIQMVCHRNKFLCTFQWHLAKKPCVLVSLFNRTW